MYLPTSEPRGSCATHSFQHLFNEPVGITFTLNENILIQDKDIVKFWR